MEQHGESTEETKHDQALDPRLDFTRPEFDPSLALQTEGLQPPVPDAPVLDNVSKCSGLLPTDAVHDEPAAAQKTAHKSAEDIAAAQAKKAKAAALKQRAQAAAQRAEASVTIGSLSSIMEKSAVGPLAVLAKWQASGQRVLVVTRHAAGIRGRAVGTLKGFDKFMNLLLADVEETYTVIVKVPRAKQQQTQQQLALQASEATGDAGSSNQLLQALAGSSAAQQQQQQLQQTADHRQQHEVVTQAHKPPDPQQQQQQQQQQAGGSAGRTRVRWRRKQEQRFRRLDQVLLVGDNVVLVSCQPQQPAALTST